jgi:Fe-S-cluster-containing hydrogenase component 2
MQKSNKVLRINYEKCTGCRLCELVCAVKHDGVSSPARSRIRIVKWEAEGIYVPMSCQQCVDAPCVAGCPVKALSRNTDAARVELDYSKCIGCRTCVSVCPFGAMHYIPADRRVIKCDLCDGDPQCVRFCDVKAVEYVDPEEVALQRGREAAKRLQTASRKAAAIA